MSAPPKPTGLAAAYQIHVKDVSNINSKCAWYVKAKLGYNKKQKSKAQKAGGDHAVNFDEIFYFANWEVKEKVELSVWKERPFMGHVEVAKLMLEFPGRQNYETCTYDLITELFPTNVKTKTEGAEAVGRDRAISGAVPDANKPCGEITVTVTHVPGHKRYLAIQAAKDGNGEAAAGPEGDEKSNAVSPQKEPLVDKDVPSEAPNSRKSQMAVAAQIKDEKEKPKQEKTAEEKPKEEEAAVAEEKPKEDEKPNEELPAEPKAEPEEKPAEPAVEPAAAAEEPAAEAAAEKPAEEAAAEPEPAAEEPAAAEPAAEAAAEEPAAAEAAAEEPAASKAAEEAAAEPAAE